MSLRGWRGIAFGYVWACRKDAHRLLHPPRALVLAMLRSPLGQVQTTAAMFEDVRGRNNRMLRFGFLPR